MPKKRQRYGNPAKRKPIVGDLNKLIQPTGVNDPRKLSASNGMLNDPFNPEAVFLDYTDIVLLESIDVCTVNNVRMGVMQEQVIMLQMNGRINKTTNQVKIGFTFGPDGAAAIITELLSVADRFGAELLSDVTQRLTKLHQDKDVDLHFLKAAIDLALEIDSAD